MCVCVVVGRGVGVGGARGAVALPALFLGGQGGAKCPFWNRNSAYNIISLFSLCVPLFTPMCPKSTILSRNVSFSVYTCALLHHQCAIFNTPTCPSKLHACPFQEFKCPSKYEGMPFSAYVCPSRPHVHFSHPSECILFNPHVPSSTTSVPFSTSPYALLSF